MYLSIVLFLVQPSRMSAQGMDEDTKKSPPMKSMKIEVTHPDSSRSGQTDVQKKLPKFDIPEYVITGEAAIDLPKSEKMSSGEKTDTAGSYRGNYEQNRRGRETVEIETGDREDGMQKEEGKYSGLIQAGMGSYFSPEFGLWFGQIFKDFHYTLGGTYHVTKGFAPNTDRSGGTFTTAGGKTIESESEIIRNADLSGEIKYGSESFHFYGSPVPDMQRTISDLELGVKLDNQTREEFPYTASLSIGNMNLSDSSVSVNETRMTLDLQTGFRINNVPIQSGVSIMSAAGGLLFTDFSGGIRNYEYAGLIFDGYIHIVISYRLTQQHRIYISYEPTCLPATLAADLKLNPYLSAGSVIRHTDVTDAGELGIESEWTKSVSSRFSLNVQSVDEKIVFSDSLIRGIWTAGYERATIVTFGAGLVAKLESNDYFSIDVLLRYGRNPDTKKKIPYLPAIEANCSAYHLFGRKVDKLAGYFLIDLSGEYYPFGYLRLTSGIKNLMGSRYEIWRGYREFPMTMYLSLQIKW
jgi:hypothetical protein